MFYTSFFPSHIVQEAAEQQECMLLLDNLKAEAEAAVKEAEAEGESLEAEKEPSDKEMQEPSEKEEKPSEKDPSEKEMQELSSQSPADEVITRLPKTLLQALSESRDLFNSLFRYSLFLRCGPNGVDNQWLPNPRNFRKATKGLNWFQFLDVSVCLCAFCAYVIFFWLCDASVFSHIHFQGVMAVDIL